MKDLQTEVQKLMESNRRVTNGHTYTVPSPDIYPFEWLWDSCFHAIILTKFDIDAAKNELHSAFSQPLSWGLIPHIIYWKKQEEDDDWGRELRGDVIDASWGRKNTSAITQPPIMAYAVWRVYECNSDPVFLADVYPILRAHYAYLLRERTFSTDYLAYIINPDESGEDNSPRFDVAQGLSPTHVAEENLEKRIELMRQNTECQFDARTCMSLYFAVADVSFNVIFAESLGYLSSIAEVLGYEHDVIYFNEQKLMVEKAMRNRLHVKNGEYYSYDNLLGNNVLVQTWNLFMPLYGGLVSEKEAKHLVEDILVNKEEFWGDWPIASVSHKEPSFDPAGGFWRGPVWMAPNWFIYHGLKRYGYDSIADKLKEKTIALIEKNGFREHYNPLTGEGLGAYNFTWGGLVLDME